MHGGLSTDEDNGMLSADENVPPAAAAACALANGVNEQHEQLVLVPLNSFRRLLAFQELRKPQFGVQGHPGFYTTKVGGELLFSCSWSSQQCACLQCVILSLAEAQQLQA